MQNLHLKLTSKYPRYNSWHQTKHHNKIHWGVLVVFTLLIFGTISLWTPISFAADIAAPTTPTNLAATPISSSQINISWTASTDNLGITGYKIYRCADSACAPTTQIATSATNSYSDTGLTASTTYTYAVSAYDAAGNESGKSISVSATTLISTGNTYYISPTGSDTNNGSEINPWATFKYAFSQMSGGDTLYVMDGVYNQQITGMPSGRPENYTKIYALNNHKVDIAGAGLQLPLSYDAILRIDGKSYVEVRGLKVHHAEGNHDVCEISNSSNIILRVMGCWHAGTYKHAKPLMIGGSSNILVEDFWAFGRGRYTIHLATDANNVIVRRAVTRFDEGAYPGEPVSGVSLYKAYNNIVENNITLDHRRGKDLAGETWSPGQEGITVRSWDNLQPESHDNFILGSLAVNLPNSVPGFTSATVANLDPDNNYFKDNVSVGSYRGFQVQDCRNCILINNSAINNIGDGFRNNVNGIDTILKNNLSYGNGGIGFINNGGSFTAFHYNGYNNNSGGNLSGFTPGTNDRTDNPNLLYPVRIENSSTYKGAGENGADIGANVIYRYVDGVLTDQPLWPWPYEDWIKEDMCDPDFLSQVGRTGANTPKWCATNKTLTQYIWEYLGNQIPCEIYNECGGAPDTMPPIVPINLTATPISSTQINLSWSASIDDVGVAGYKIYRNGVLLTTNPSPLITYQNTGLTAGTAYTYTVSAYDAAGNESNQSISASASTSAFYKQSDLNQDTKVNQLDFDILKQDWNRTDKPKSDLNQDGIVDSRDLGILMSEWGR